MQKITVLVGAKVLSDDKQMSGVMMTCGNTKTTTTTSTKTLRMMP
ncbi:hypothetical protein [Moraxella bovoculi]|nr:hypothetical protein [Moraxella bovoculi]